MAFPTSFQNHLLQKKTPVLVGLLFAIAGTSAVLFGHAATPALSLEAEAGALQGCAAAVNDSAASGGHAVAFQGSGCSGTTSSAGATLPISYNLSSLTGNARYVATNGSDTSGNGTAAAPYATVAKAYSVATSGDSIVVRGGTYRQGGLNFAANKSVKLTAYPGEVPVFDGAQALSSGWVTEGAYKYHAYTPRPTSDAMGVTLSSGMNLTPDQLGKYPDQAWVGTTQLKQVAAKTSVTNSSFWVDTANRRIYVMAANADSGTLEASNIGRFAYIQASGMVIQGFKITRFSNTPTDYGVITVSSPADNVIISNIELSDTAFQGIFYGGGSDTISGATLSHDTISGTGWVAIGANYTDNLTLDGMRITNANPFGEFVNSPESGALKATAADGTRVLNSYIADNNSQGLWFDQSDYHTDVANNTILDNGGAGVFYEISDDLLLANNYIVSKGGNAVKLAGSSGLKLVNNTIVGGPDALGVYTDSRSKPGCSVPGQPLCAGSYNSDRDNVRPHQATMDWIPRIDLMLDNIIAYPTAAGYCGASSGGCITLSNSGATVAAGTIIHKADSLRPQTQINGDVYANGVGRILSVGGTGYASTGAFSTAMASQTGISGLEANGLAGNNYVNADGTPTSSLSAVNAQAPATPTDTRINQYVPAGTHHYGSLSR